MRAHYAQINRKFKTREQIKNNKNCAEESSGSETKRLHANNIHINMPALHSQCNFECFVWLWFAIAFLSPPPPSTFLSISFNHSRSLCLCRPLLWKWNNKKSVIISTWICSIFHSVQQTYASNNSNILQITWIFSGIDVQYERF